MRKSVLTLSLCVLLAGCNSGVDKLKPLSMEEVMGNRLEKLSADEKEGMIYRLVSDSILIDKEKLVKIDTVDKENIDKLVNDINKGIQGYEVNIDKSYLNFMLLLMTQTPYEWKYDSTDYVGFDPASRLYFVDVIYKTTSTYKSVVPTSKIPNGDKDEDALKQQRYKDYITYLMLKSRGADWQGALKSFEEKWGKVNDIMVEQQGLTLLERTKLKNNGSNGLGKITYTGMIQDSKVNTGGELKVRLVLKYNYSLGEEKDMKLESLYLNKYELNNKDSILNSYKTDEEDMSGIEVLKPFIDRLIYSYNKAVNGYNEKGLNSLYYNYGLIDKYYEDLNKYAYMTIGNYKYEVVGKYGREIYVKVDRANKFRAKGSNMSLPVYDESLLFVLVMGNDDKLRIKDVHLLSSKLIGEPLSVVKNVTGVSDYIQFSGDSFTTENKEKVEQTLKKFLNAVYEGNITSKNLLSTIDMGISESSLKKIHDTISSIQGTERKINYIVSWDTKTNVFVSVTVREIFEKDDGNIDTEATIDLINRGSEWKVINYTRNLSVKTKKEIKVNEKLAFSINE